MKMNKILLVSILVLSIFKPNYIFSSEKSTWIRDSLQEIDNRIGSLEEDIKYIQKEIGLKGYKICTPQVENNKEEVKINISNVNPDTTNINTTNTSLNATIITDNGEIELSINNNLITTTIKSKAQGTNEQKNMRSSFYTSSASKTVKSLDGKLDFSNTEAKFSDNTLEIVIPKIQDTPEKKVNIKK